MKPSGRSGSRSGREKFPIVYVNSFGSHRSGTVIHYGGPSRLRHHKEEAKSNTPICLSDRKISGGSTHPSPSGGRRPCRVPGAALSTGGERTQRQGDEATEFKSLTWSEARTVVTESLLSTKDGGNKKKAPSSTFHNSHKPMGGEQETQGGVFEFSSPSENVNNCANGQQKKKSTAWLRVSKVISKMIEENECLRNRLMSCSQLPQEGHAINQNSQGGDSCIETEEAIFGWV